MSTTKLHTRRAILAAGINGTAVLALGACGASDSSAPKNSGKPSGELQILVSSADASDTGFKAVNAAFEKKYPDVKIVFSAVPNENYQAAESSRLTAGNVDMLVINSSGRPLQDTPSFAKGSESDAARLASSGAFVDLTQEPFMKNFQPTVLQKQAYQGKQYAVPTGLSYVTGSFYNKTMFRQNGIAVPTTWTELIAACGNLKSAGITPFGIGGGGGEPSGQPMLAAVQSLYPTRDAKLQLAQGLWNQSIKLTDPKPVEILQRTQIVYQNAQKNFVGTPYAAVSAGFAAGKYAMAPDGTWSAETYAEAVGNKFDFGYFPMPMSDNAQDNASLAGKIELQLAVSSATKNKTTALAWLNFFAEPTNYKLFLSKSGFASAQPNIATSDFLKSIARYTTVYQPSWEQIWLANNAAGQDAVYPFNYPALQPVGTKDPQQAAEAAQQAWSGAF